jgi:hypothetical protein
MLNDGLLCATKGPVAENIAQDLLGGLDWAVIQPTENDGCRVHFFGDTAGIFDAIDFANSGSAESALKRNGFKRYAEDSEAQQFIAKPRVPFEMRDHPNGPIYSSGRFWR